MSPFMPTPPPMQPPMGSGVSIHEIEYYLENIFRIDQFKRFIFTVLFCIDRYEAQCRTYGRGTADQEIEN